MRISKKQAIKAAGSATKLAEILGITKGAVYLWDVYVPEGSSHRLLEIHPTWFPAATRARVADLRASLARLDI